MVNKITLLSTLTTLTVEDEPESAFVLKIAREITINVNK